MVEVSSLPSVELQYRIAKCTGYSGKYVPEHILVNAPTDQTSRWSGANQPATKQWIILELAELSLVRSITFGKFHKPHPCNIKEFKVYTGRSIDTLVLTLHAGLNNDSIPETFDLQRQNEAGLLCPVRFVKIVPLSAHSPSFNTSIWHISLSGVNDTSVVERAENAYANFREISALRHVLKYLRQRRHFSSFRSLLSRTGIMLEHPVVTKIYDNLMSGDWSFVEMLLQTAANDGLFDAYIQACDPKAFWHRLNGANPDGDIPTSRGGHQMCVDSEAGVVYLFGGWDGEKNLDDLWSYSISEGRWKMLSFSTAAEEGPGPRSCHKMVFDPLLGYIYLLGRLADGEGPRPPSPSDTVTPAHPQNGSTAPSSDAVEHSSSQSRPVATAVASENGTGRFTSDFYRYTTRGPNAGRWTLLSKDTALEGGPPLIYDHQITIDSEKQMIYVFGGRIVDGNMDSSNAKFSGLYQYNIVTGKWEHLFDESKPSRGIPPRFGHSMVFDPRYRRLVILAGKRCDHFLADMYSYDVDSQEVTDVTSDFSSAGGPDPCFCQRSAVDPESGHIYVLPGLLKPKGQMNTVTDGTLRSNFWIFRPEVSQWTRVHNSRSHCPETSWSDPEAELEPQPRYAHQMVYDHVRKAFFVHGGNSGRRRLDDFWSMTFERPPREEMVRRAKFITRRQHFKELCETIQPVHALTFLQRDVHAVVDHLSDEETATFRALHSHLFEKASQLHPPPTLKDGDIEMTSTEPGPSDLSSKPGDRRSTPGVVELNADDDEGEAHAGLTPERFRQRTHVFESLLELINPDAKQPASDLIDLVETQDKDL